MNTFAYLVEEGNSIIASESLLSHPTILSQSRSDLNQKYFVIHKLMEKDVKLQWHIVSLSDYWWQGSIPRGLRIQEFRSI